MHDDLDLFGDDDMAVPTMRGNANLDVQDYSRASGGDSSFLDDELQEDTPSRPGDGAGPAFDIDGVDGPFMEDDDAPGMDQTTFGAHPWGPGASEGYRPASMQRTGADLRGLDDSRGDDTRKPKPAERDSMHDEPEVVAAERAMRAITSGQVIMSDRPQPVPRQRWFGNRNQEPSNAEIDPLTIYDRDSYEHDDSSQNVIGSGIFGMEEGVTWRPRDGIFAHQYALPGYIAEEDELGVQQSEMWDTTAKNWRTTQVSQGGIAMTKRVSHLKPAYSPFSKNGVGETPDMRPEITGPRSHIEAFGRKAAAALVEEARRFPAAKRSAFIVNALEILSPGMAARAHAVADRMVQMGYPPEAALEDVVAHCVMHAATKDLTSSSALPRLDGLAGAVQTARPKMQRAAMQHIAPIRRNRGALQADLGALASSPAARGMGQVTSEATVPTAPTAPGAGLLSPRNLLLAGVAGGIGWLAWSNRRTITRNAKKLARKVGL